jgi:hypothetical protein
LVKFLRHRNSYAANTNKCCVSNSCIRISPVCPHTDDKAVKMLRSARMAAMTGCTAAS